MHFQVQRQWERKEAIMGACVSVKEKTSLGKCFMAHQSTSQRSVFHTSKSKAFRVVCLFCSLRANNGTKTATATFLLAYAPLVYIKEHIDHV